MIKYQILNVTEVTLTFTSSFAPGSSQNQDSLKFECRYQTVVNGLNANLNVAPKSGNGLSRQGSLHYEIEISEFSGRTLITIRPEHHIDINLT